MTERSPLIPTLSLPEPQGHHGILPIGVFKGSKPVMCTHPDGSVYAAFPPGFKPATPPPSPRFTPFGPRMGEGESVMDDFDFIYSRHLKMFLSLIFIQFMVETSFNVMYALYSHERVREIAYFYHAETDAALHMCSSAFWAAYVGEIAYCLIYYSLAATAAWGSSLVSFQRFTNVALCGLFGQILLAYMNKFNLLVFFLRLMAYLYSKFMRTLLLSWNGLDQDA